MTGIILLVLLGALATFGLGHLLLYLVQEYTDPIPPAVPGTTRVACVGDSITYGSMVRHRRQNSYPAQLQILLGQAYSVRNFGVNGHTMQKVADLPYWKHKNFKASSDFAPNIVLIMLGTNDTKAHNWKGVQAYKRDCREMLAHYRSLPSRPDVYLLIPPKLFTLGKLHVVSYRMNVESMVAIGRVLRELGREENVPVIDVYTATAAHPEHFRIDGVHPDAAGARLIAETVYAAWTAENE